jgi:NADH-quinone oxidoreductase subunit E
LPLLHIVQEELGYISKESIEWIAERLGLEPINIYELVTFYPMLREKPIGCRHVKVCRTLSCALHGAYEVKRIIEKELSESANGNFANDYTVEFVECIASCGTAPVVQVDEVLYEGITVDKVVGFTKNIIKETQEIKKKRSR